jgi:hypothetical protein
MLVDGKEKSAPFRLPEVSAEERDSYVGFGGSQHQKDTEAICAAGAAKVNNGAIDTLATSGEQFPHKRRYRRRSRTEEGS